MQQDARPFPSHVNLSTEIKRGGMGLASQINYALASNNPTPVTYTYMYMGAWNTII